MTPDWINDLATRAGEAQGRLDHIATQARTVLDLFEAGGSPTEIRVRLQHIVDVAERAPAATSEARAAA